MLLKLLILFFFCGIAIAGDKTSEDLNADRLNTLALPPSEVNSTASEADIVEKDSSELSTVERHEGTNTDSKSSFTGSSTTVQPGQRDVGYMNDKASPFTADSAAEGSTLASNSGKASETMTDGEAFQTETVDITDTTKRVTMDEVSQDKPSTVISLPPIQNAAESRSELLTSVKSTIESPLENITNIASTVAVDLNDVNSTEELSSDGLPLLARTRPHEVLNKVLRKTSAGATTYRPREWSFAITGFIVAYMAIGI